MQCQMFGLHKILSILLIPAVNSTQIIVNGLARQGSLPVRRSDFFWFCACDMINLFPVRYSILLPYR